MKRLALVIILLAQLLGVQAQTLNVNIGQVTYAHPAAKAADMTFSENGTQLTIQGRSYAVADIDNIIVDNSEVADSTVSVVFSGSTAKVVVSGSIANRITAAVSGANVTVTAADDLDGEVYYVLSGSSTNGSFTQNGAFKSTFTLNNLTLTSTNGAAVYINNGKRSKVKIVGTNTLTDSANGEQKACFASEGHVEMSGEGVLNITGKSKHGLATDEYLEFKSGTLNILGAVSDGMHVKQYFQMKDGKITVNAQGDGIDIEAKNNTEKEFNGQCFINGGQLTITTTGAATKGLKADALITVSGGTTNITTTGDAYFDSTAADISSSSAMKTDGGFTMTDGTLTLTSTGIAGKGLNTVDEINISGGTITAVTTGETIVQTVNKVQIDSKAHGIKTDDNIIITGGTVLVAASSYSGYAFKQDLLLKINGGKVMGIGAKKVTPAKSSTQGSATYAGINVKGGTTVTYDGVSFPIPAVYNNSAAQILVSSPSL